MPVVTPIEVFARLSEQELNRISDLFAAKSSALPKHNLQAQSEKGSVTHSFTRHGYQTGWESQLMRLVTGRTPDQPDDFDGVADAVDKYTAKNLLPKREQGKIEYAKADSTGAFLSPEVATFALDAAFVKAGKLLEMRFAEVEVKGIRSWHPYEYVDMVVAGRNELSGVSFKRDKRFPAVAEHIAVEAIHDFIHQKRVGPVGSTRTLEQEKNILQIMDDVGVAGPYTRSAVRRDYKLRFPNMSDLLTFLHVEALWMKNVNVVLRRFGNNWKLHTAYCVGCIEVPSNPRGKPDVKAGKWTGNLRKTHDGEITFLDPESLK